MKKYLFYLVILFIGASLFSACSDDDDKKVVIDDSITGVYKGALDIEAILTDGSKVPGKVTQKIYIDKTGDNTLKLQLKNFQFSGLQVGDISVDNIDVRKDGNTHAFSSKTSENLTLGTCDLDINGTIEGEKALITIGVEVVDGMVKGTKVVVNFNGTKLAADQSSEAVITAFTIDSEYVTIQPIIENKNITFYVTDTIPAEILASLVPEIKISDKATISPKSGEQQDFSKPVKYTVTSEDGITVTEYTVTVGGKARVYDFEEWVPGNPGQEPENTFFEVAGGWSSSNTGAFLLKQFFQLTDRVPVTQNTDAHSGKSAARIETLDTKGEDKVIAKVPKVTTGTLFLGAFKPDLSNTLASTKFGIPFATKPTVLKGFYKYTPGEVYYQASKEAPHEATAVEGKKDECSINAILYEVSTFDDEDYAEYLTGVDVNTSDRLVAVAQLEDGTAKSEYTSFEIEFKYLKTYDPAKKYRLSIICSSSKDGDSFSGAPGSVLFVDDFELISE